MNAWYATLHRPPLSPPNWIFGPVWTALYIMIAVAIVGYWRSPRKEHAGRTASVLVLHLFSNFIWTYLFFGLQSPGTALIDILFLDISLLFLIRWFWLANRWTGALLVPYLIWVLFATYLNAGFYLLN